MEGRCVQCKPQWEPLHLHGLKQPRSVSYSTDYSVFDLRSRFFPVLASLTGG